LARRRYAILTKRPKGRPKKFSSEKRLELGEQLHWFYHSADVSMTVAARRFGVSEGFAWKLYDEYLNDVRAKKVNLPK